ncbi:MAG: efflux RND transporter periplasmic adaptor subunit [Candidatus Staskawiczbacteria bacterium]|nr:efflux RND transporter periplasmic adaptor subunit [Candidatus Staskawiczbacteria bacterium]
MNFKTLILKRKWTAIILAVILIVAGYFIFSDIFKNPLEDYVIEKVESGEVLQEVSETGSVKATENISLGFKISGRIQRINVFIGQDVKKGDDLAQLDSRQILAQLQNAKAGLDAAKKEYEKLLQGPTEEDIKTYQNAVDSASNDLESSYSDSLNDLRDAYTKIYNSYTTAYSVQNNYFSSSDQPGIKAQNSVKVISDNLNNIKNYLDAAEKTLAKADIDQAISQMLSALDNVYLSLKTIREQSDEGVYYSKVSSTDKSSLDTHRGNINTALSNVKTARQNISADKIDLQDAKDHLAFKTAPARQEEADIEQARIRQAEANVDLYQSQLNDNFLRSPIDGKITDIDAEPGEVVSPNESVINMLSTAPFQIKVNIYEQDIVNVRIGNNVKIDLIAFPKKTFSGKVLSINPAEKIVDNIVYYETTVDFEEQPEGIRSGMTADIAIETNKKENVLRIAKNAVEKINNEEIAEVAKNGRIEKKVIITGLEGNEYYEVVSGLNEGDRIIASKK